MKWSLGSLGKKLRRGAGRRACLVAKRPPGPATALARCAAMAAAMSLALALLTASAAFAVEPDERLADPALEARARGLSKELRCLVCQNESIDDSGADLAHDLRVLLRERLKDGDSDKQALQFLVDRYGDFILLKPPFKLSTLLLWLSAPLAFLAGALGIWSASRRKPSLPAPLSAEEERRLAELNTDGAA